MRELLVILGVIMLVGSPGCAGSFSTGRGNVTDVLVDGQNCRGAHVTTRPHNRKVIFFAPGRRWFVFYGTGHWTDDLGDEGLDKEIIACRSSKDGLAFGEMMTCVSGNGHSSSADVLLVGDRVYLTHARFGYWRSKAGIPSIVDGKRIWHPDRIRRDQPNHYAPYEVFPFRIVDGQLVPQAVSEALPGDEHVGHAGPHYGSITRDTSGHLWVAARALTKVGPDGHLATWVARTAQPDNVSIWEPHTVLFESSGPGTHAPQIIALDDDRVACVLFTKCEKRTAVYVYDPTSRTWCEPHVLGEGYLSKRACAVFDPNSRRLHVVYTDAAGDARHRFLSAPYGRDKWCPPLASPGILVAPEAGANKGDDDLSLSANLSRTPAPLALLHRGPERCLHLRYYDGHAWSAKEMKVGTQLPTVHCDEVSAVADFSHGLGFVYWAVWSDPDRRNQSNHVGQLRFCLVRNVEALFAGGKDQTGTAGR